MSFLASTAQNYIRYSDGLEEIAPDEQETFTKIAELMSKGADNVREKDGYTARVSHAKAHGVVKGKLVVSDALPEYLRQGLFAQPGTYDVIVRLAQAPGEILDDSKVSSPRGFSIKVLGVQGVGAQDFLLSTGPAFIAPGAKDFLKAFKPSAEIAPSLSETTKGVVSTLSRATNAALHAVGTESGKLDFFGHPYLHPLSESYYSQAAHRYGEYVAKFNLLPTSPALKALVEQKLDPQGDPNALRKDVADYFRTHDAEFTFGVQLATDLDTMSVEDATVAWPEDTSPYQVVARLLIPAQDAYTPERAAYAEKLSYSPAHTLPAFRPLGSINRARLHVYGVLSAKRHREMGAADAEPESIGAFPA